MKNKVIILLLTMGVIVSGAFIYQRNNLSKINNKQENNIIKKVTPKNQVSYIDGYIEQNYEIKDGLLNGENVKILTSWVDSSHVSFENKLVRFSLAGSDICETVNVETSIDNVYIIQNGTEIKLSADNIKAWSRDKLVNFQIYYTSEVVSANNVFIKIFEWLTPNAEASCRWTTNLKDIKKIIFYFPEYQASQNIKVNNIYSINGGDAALPATEEGLNLIIDKEATKFNDKAFFIMRMATRGKFYITLKDNTDLIEIDDNTNIPFSSIVDYNLIGNFVCSYFNDYCFFIVSDAIIHTNLELIGDKMKSSFEYSFSEDDPSHPLSKKDGKYYLSLWEDNVQDLINASVNIDMTEFVKNNEDKIDRDNNFGGAFIKNNIYVKGNVECVKDTTYGDIPNIECIVIPAMVRIID